MAKAAKKSPKEASKIFHNIMKASVQDKKNDEPREWIYYDHPTTHRKYVIRYYYEDEDKMRKCKIFLMSFNPAKNEEELIRSFEYKPELQGLDIDEKAKVIAMDHGNMQPPDQL